MCSDWTAAAGIVDPANLSDRILMSFATGKGLTLEGMPPKRVREPQCLLTHDGEDGGCGCFYLWADIRFPGCNPTGLAESTYSAGVTRAAGIYIIMC